MKYNKKEKITILIIAILAVFNVAVSFASLFIANGSFPIVLPAGVDKLVPYIAMGLDAVVLLIMIVAGILDARKHINRIAGFKAEDQIAEVQATEIAETEIPYDENQVTEIQE